MAFLTQAAVEQEISRLTPLINQYNNFAAVNLDSQRQEAERLERQLLTQLGKGSMEEFNQAVKEATEGCQAISRLFSSNIVGNTIEDVFLKELGPIFDTYRNKRIAFDQQFLKDAGEYLEREFFSVGGVTTVTNDVIRQKLNSVLSHGGSFAPKVDVTNISESLGTGIKAALEEAAADLLRQFSIEQRQAFLKLLNDYKARRQQITNYNLENIFKKVGGEQEPTMSYTLTNDTLKTTLQVKDFDNVFNRSKILKLFTTLNESDLSQMDPSFRSKLVESFRNYIINRLGGVGIDAELQTILKEKVFNTDISISRLIFQGGEKGGNAMNHLRGLLGEVLGLYIFKKVFNKEIEWNAQSLIGGEQSPTDLILRLDGKSYGIQVKNYSQSYSRVNYSDLSMNKLEEYCIKIPHGVEVFETIKQIYQLYTFNIKYTYRKGKAVQGENKNFSGTRSKIDSLKKMAEGVLAQFSSAIMGLQIAERNGLVGETGGNALYLMGNKFISSAEILRDIALDVKTSGFRTSTMLEGKAQGETIVDYINSHKLSSYTEAEIKITSSYNFGGFRT